MGDETEALRQREGDQALPVPNDETSCQQRFMDWVNETAPPRMELGRRRYGTLLQPFNGRNFVRDVDEELFDLSVYWQGVKAEREAMMALLDNLATSDVDERDLNELAAQARELLTSMGVPGHRRFGHSRDGSDCAAEECGGTRYDPCGYSPEEIEEFDFLSKSVDLEDARVCPVHGMTDCSPMLNGCNRVTRP